MRPSSPYVLSTYGTIEVARKLDEVDNVYDRGKKKAEIIRRRPGVSPVVIGKYRSARQSSSASRT